jgi:cbb3-type cytochrome c oxidase subunit III
MNTAAVLALAVLGLAAVGAAVYLLRASNKGKSPTEHVPPGLRPGYSDEQLEKSVLERYMAWGVVLTLFFAIFFPIYWINESNRLNAEKQGFFVGSVEQGKEVYEENCAQCHGSDLGGGATSSEYSDEAWPVPALNNIVARYQDNENIEDIRQFVKTTVERGRPGTPMPTWSAAFNGPLTDQQITNVVDYVLSEQTGQTQEAQQAAGVSGEQLYAKNCMRCHGENLGGVLGPPLIGVFERHNRQDILGILRNGIQRPTGPVMPAWQAGYQHTPYTDGALNRIVDYLKESQPETIPPDLQDSVAPPVPPPESVQPGGSESPSPSDSPSASEGSDGGSGGGDGSTTTAFGSTRA